MHNNIFFGKKILIFKKKKYSSYYDPVLESIIREGKPMYVFYTKYKNFNNIVEVNEEILKKIKKHKIDIFLSASYFPFNTHYLKNIQKLCHTIRIDGDDDSLMKSYSMYISNFFDLNITTSPSAAKKFKKYGNASLALPIFYRRKKKLKHRFKHDVSFVGILRGKNDRLDYINEIRKNQISLDVFGPDTKKLKYREVLNVFQKSKINLNFSKLNNDMPILNKHDKSLKSKSGIKSRLFEIMNCGGFVLTEYTKDLNYFFPEKKYLETFKNKKELISKIKFFLKNNSKRKMIAKNGKLFFDKNFSEKNYSSILINQITQKMKYKKFSQKIDINGSYKKNYREFFSYFLSKKDLLLILSSKREFHFLISYQILFIRLFNKFKKLI
tara:strand:- start:2814 stop:3962 length:1149 start_codon:yes stop_codon:yes gene_type:complete